MIIPSRGQMVQVSDERTGRAKAEFEIQSITSSDDRLEIKVSWKSDWWPSSREHKVRTIIVKQDDPPVYVDTTNVGYENPGLFDDLSQNRIYKLVTVALACKNNFEIIKQQVESGGISDMHFSQRFDISKQHYTHYTYKVANKQDIFH